MNNFSILKLTVILLTSMFLMSSCDDDSTDNNSKDYSIVLNDIANNVIVSTYQELDTKAEVLTEAVMELEQEKSTSNLEIARNAWIDTRKPWEQSEGFLFGPVDTEGIDPSIDSWPVNIVDLENVLSSSNVLTATFVNSLEGTLKGFHTIEFLLWGADGQKQITDFTDREFEYLIATSEVLSDDAQSLSDAWESANGNFVENVVNAGQSSSIYISQKAALEELAAGILGIADEVGNGKINDPLEQEDLSLEESQFSDNSKTDFTDNIRSIQHVYSGLNGQGLSDIILEENASLDGQIRTEIQEAIDAIQSITGTFTEAIPSNSPTRIEAESAQEAVRTLQATFESQLIPLISNL